MSSATVTLKIDMRRSITFILLDAQRRSSGVRRLTARPQVRMIGLRGFICADALSKAQQQSLQAPQLARRSKKVAPLGGQCLR